jgi:hypothetical protein
MTERKLLHHLLLTVAKTRHNLSAKFEQKFSSFLSFLSLWQKFVFPKLILEPIILFMKTKRNKKILSDVLYYMMTARFLGGLNYLFV